MTMMRSETAIASPRKAILPSAPSTPLPAVSNMAIHCTFRLATCGWRSMNWSRTCRPAPGCATGPCGSTPNSPNPNDASPALPRPTRRRWPRHQDWFTLQRVAAALPRRQPGREPDRVGEYQREYRRLGFQLETTDLVFGTSERMRLKAIAEGRTGLFELRRLELTRGIHAKVALVRIRDGAAQLIAHADKITATAQEAIAAERTNTTSATSLQKTVILFVGIGSAALALSAALYVSGYVTGNLRAVSGAMRRLAAGDRSIRLPRGDDARDEIGDLFRSFRTFRANALRLDRSNRQLHQRNALLEKVFANMTDGVAETDEAGRIRYANPNIHAVLRIDRSRHGVEEIGSLFADAHFAPAARSKALDAAFPGRHRTAVRGWTDHRSARQPFAGQWCGSGLFSDIAERRKLDERLNQIHRIEALGMVVGEVAHDFGNVLSTISTNLYMLEKPRPPDEAQSLLQRIAKCRRYRHVADAAPACFCPQAAAGAGSRRSRPAHGRPDRSGQRRAEGRRHPQAPRCRTCRPTSRRTPASSKARFSISASTPARPSKPRARSGFGWRSKTRPMPASRSPIPASAWMRSPEPRLSSRSFRPAPTARAPGSVCPWSTAS